MATVVIDGIEYCLEQSPDEDDGDNINKPSTTEIKDTEVVSHCK